MKRINIILRLLPVLAALLVCLPCRGAQPSASESIGKMADALKKSPNLEITFTIYTDGASSSGSMVVNSQRFHLSTPEMKIWYDGKTQWATLDGSGEVNVTTPTAAELAQSNPFSLLSSLGNAFTFTRMKAAAGTEKILLTPKKPTDELSSATVTINASTHLPTEITVKDSAGTLTTVKITTLKNSPVAPLSRFRFDPKANPSLEVVDLR